MSLSIADLNKLRITEHSLSKSINTLCEHLKQREDQDFIESLQKSENLRNLEVKKLHEQLRNTYALLNKLKQQISEKNPNIDLQQIRADMVAIQMEIENTKLELKNKLDILQKEESPLYAEIKAYESKLQEWDKVGIKTAKEIEKQVYRRSYSSTTSHICQEAEDFQKFVFKSGGHENGWTAEDHRLFLKIRGRSKDIEQLTKRLHKLLPDISEEEINRHEKWYQQYSELLKKQKEAIEMWKKNKNSRVNTAKSTSSLASSKIVKYQVADVENIREKIIQWKIAKEEATKKQNEAKLEEKLKQLQEQKSRQIRNEANKKAIIEWKHNKISREEMEKAAIQKAKLQEKESRSRQANKLIKEFQKQDSLYINRKRENAKRSNSTEVLVPKIIAARDPERLLKPTQNWLKRTQSLPSKSTEDVYTVRQIAKLKQPDWRKGLQ